MEQTKQESKQIVFELDITSRDLISATARECKFHIGNNDFMYTNNSIDKLTNFMSAVRFFIAIANNIKISEEIRTIFKGYINKVSVKYEEALYLYFKQQHSRLAKQIWLEKINKFLIENNILINNTIDNAFQIGRQVKQFDADENQGTY